MFTSIVCLQFLQGAGKSEKVDWTSLPTSLLINIFETVVQCQLSGHHDYLATAKDILRAYDAISRTCKAWQRAIRLVPLSIVLDTDVQAAFQRTITWMSRNSIRDLVITSPVASFVRLRPQAIQGNAFDLALLMDKDFIANSKGTLQTIMNVSFSSVHLLPTFQNLTKVSLYNPYVSKYSTIQAFDPAHLHRLTGLTCLSLRGLIRRPVPWKSFPPTLRHLLVNAEEFNTPRASKIWTYRDGFYVSLPKSLSQLEYLSVTATMPVIDWHSMTHNTCLELHISGAGVSFLLPPQPDEGADEPPTEQRTDQLLKRFCDMLVSASSLCRLNMKCSKIEVLPARWEKQLMGRSFGGLGGMGWVATVEDALRQHLLCSWDVHMEENFVNAPPTSITSHCICKIKADRQTPGKPRGYHLRWPLGPKEVLLLKTFPARRIVWHLEDKDGFGKMLRDPEFIAANAPTLKRLVGVTLPQDADLRPLKVLESLYLQLSPSSSSPFPLAGIRLPSSLVWLSLSSPQPGGILWAPALAGLTNLRGLVLDGWSKTDLSNVAPSLKTLQIRNPMGDLSPVTGPETMKLPKHMDAEDAEHRDATGTRSWGSFRIASPLIAAQLMVRCSNFDLDEEEIPESSLSPASVVSFKDSWRFVYESAADHLEAFVPDDVDMECDVDVDVSGDDREGWRAPCMFHLDDRPDQYQKFNLAGHTDDTYDLYFVKGIEPYNIGKHGLPFFTAGTSRIDIYVTCGLSQFVLDMLWLVKARVECICIFVEAQMETCLGDFPIVHADCGCSWPEFKRILKDSVFGSLRINAGVDEFMFVFREHQLCCGTVPAYNVYEVLKLIEGELGHVFTIQTALDGEVEQRPGVLEDGVSFEILRK